MSVPSHPLRAMTARATGAVVTDLDAHRRTRELERAVRTLQLVVHAIGRTDLVDGLRTGDLASVVVGRGSVMDLDETATNRLRSARKDVADMLHEHLGPRERDVLTARFGLQDGQERTQADVGSELRVSIGMVAELESRALSRLRHPAFADVLERCLDD